MNISDLLRMQHYSIKIVHDEMKHNKTHYFVNPLKFIECKNLCFCISATCFDESISKLRRTCFTISHRKSQSNARVLDSSLILPGYMGDN